jgi:hypothetical protein
MARHCIRGSPAAASIFGNGTTTVLLVGCAPPLPFGQSITYKNNLEKNSGTDHPLPLSCLNSPWSALARAQEPRASGLGVSLYRTASLRPVGVFPTSRPIHDRPNRVRPTLHRDLRRPAVLDVGDILLCRPTQIGTRRPVFSRFSWFSRCRAHQYLPRKCAGKPDPQPVRLTGMDASSAAISFTKSRNALILAGG